MFGWLPQLSSSISKQDEEVQGLHMGADKVPMKNDFEQVQAEQDLEIKPRMEEKAEELPAGWVVEYTLVDKQKYYFKPMLGQQFKTYEDVIAFEVARSKFDLGITILGTRLLKLKRRKTEGTMGLPISIENVVYDRLIDVEEHVCDLYMKVDEVSECLLDCEILRTYASVEQDPVLQKRARDSLSEKGQHLLDLCHEVQEMARAVVPTPRIFVERTARNKT